MLSRLRSALDGLLWLLRPTGLRKTLRLLDQRLDSLTRELVETQDRVSTLASPTNFAVPVHGHAMYLDRHDTLGLSLNHTHEPFQTALVQSLVRPGDVVVDAGAHIGYYTLLFARAVGPAGRVIAIEPSPHAVFLLHRNARANGYLDRVAIEEAALHRATARVPFWTCESGLVGGAVHRPGGGWAWEELDVRALALDDALPAGARVDLVKMDLQGGEGFALEGMRRVLVDNPNVKLLLEYWPSGLVSAGVRPERVVEGLAQAGFRVADVREEERAIVPTDATELARRYPEDRLDHTNLLCERTAP